MPIFFGYTHGVKPMTYVTILSALVLGVVLITSVFILLVLRSEW